MELTKEYITTNLLPIINQLGEKLEGSIFTTHKTTNYNKRFIVKQKQLQTIVNNLEGDTIDILEIGFNAGFSSLLMLYSNPNVIINCIDIGSHSYIIPCYNKIKEDFPDRIFLTIGNSVDVLSEVYLENKKFNLIHIDGGHTIKIARADINNSLKKINSGGLIVFDDYNLPTLKKVIDSYNFNNISNNELQAVFYQ